MTTSTRRHPGVIAILDWATAAVSLLVGIYLVATQWPQPDVWAWIFLGGGILGFPLAYFNPLGQLRKWMLRRLVKRR